MKGTVPADQAVTRMERPLPARVQEGLGELVGAAQEGLSALSVGVGLGVLVELMAEEVATSSPPENHTGIAARSSRSWSNDESGVRAPVWTRVEAHPRRGGRGL